MNPKIVIDTSIWIEFFNHIDTPHNQLTQELIHSNSALLIGPVLFELLQGARNPREIHLLQEALFALSFIEIDRKLWLEAGLLSQKLRKNGITIPMTDCVIAAAAMSHKCLIYTLDQHFDHFPDLLYKTSPPIPDIS